jgi:hypothetical protein
MTQMLFPTEICASLPLKICGQRETFQSRSSSKIYKSLSEVLYVGIRVGNVAQAHVRFRSLDTVSQTISQASIPNGGSFSKAPQRLTKERRSPVNRDCVSAASTAFLKYSVAGRRMPLAST